MTIWIYGLFDPREPSRIRYVGQSCWPRVRLKQHYAEQGESDKCVWIRGLREEGLRPSITILKRTNSAHANQCERDWIVKLSSHGLTNAAIPFRLRIQARPDNRALVYREWMAHTPVGTAPQPTQIKSLPKLSGWSGLEGIEDSLVLGLVELERRWQSERKFSSL